MTSQKKPSSESTDSAQDLMVDECGKKIHYTQIHMLLGNSNAKSLQIVLSPDCSNMNAYL